MEEENDERKLEEVKETRLDERKGKENNGKKE